MSSGGPVIVNYAQVEDAFGSGPQAVTRLAGRSTTSPEDVDTAAGAVLLDRALTALHAAQVEPDVMSSPDDRVAAALQTVLAQHAADLGTPEPLAAGGRAVRFDDHDPRWTLTLLGLLRDRLRIGRFDFRPGPRVAHPLPDTARIAVLGDWGTNLYGAPHVAASVQDDGRFDALVHLGDVYYSGSTEEVLGRFLAEWPQVAGAVNRACNSNHEMFSGGKPYVEQTLSRFEQSSSLFWLENNHWVLAGLDSAYDDGELAPLQVAWLRAVVGRTSAAGKRVVLFSHHPAWRTAEGEQQPLVDPILDLLASGQVAAWYWGHEHLCSLFDPHPSWGLVAACVGHGGMPYRRLDVSGWPATAEVAEAGAWHAVPARGGVPAGLLLDGPNRWISGHESTFGPNGYAVLELDGPALREVVLTASGQPIHERVL